MSAVFGNCRAIVETNRSIDRDGYNGRTTMFQRLVGIVIVAVVASSDALSQQSLQELESTSQFEQALAAVDAIKNRKRLQCVLAITIASTCPQILLFLIWSVHIAFSWVASGMRNVWWCGLDRSYPSDPSALEFSELL